jgi:hypothetical protein
MNKDCQELLENIQRTLHECRDNRKTVEICGALDVRQCKNVNYWASTIKDSIPLNVEIKHPILTHKYSIDYKVRERSLVISEVSPS